MKEIFYLCTKYDFIIMKRFLIYILTVLYIAISSGFAINLHYCKGKLADWHIGDTKEMCTSCGTKKMTSKCCSNETYLIKLDVDQSMADTPTSNIVPMVVNLLPVMYEQFILLGEESHISYNFNKNFNIKDVPIFIYHCLLLI